MQTSFWDMNPSSPSNGTPIVAESSENAPQTDGSLTCVCGKETSGCSIHPNTRDEWILSQQVSLAKILAALEIKPGSAKEHEADFTEKCSELLASFDPATYFWKTSQQSLLTDSWEPFSETWPRAGMMRDGRVYRHRQPVPRTTVIGGGALRNVPTPTVNGNYNRKGASQNSGDGLATYVKMWPTPTATLADHGGRITPSKARSGGTLIEAVSQRMWPTPVADDACNRKEGKWNSRGEPKLSAQVKMWPTPQTRGYTNDGDLAALARMCANYEEMKGMAYGASDKKKRSFWPTPCASAAKGSSPASLTRTDGRSRSNDRPDHAVMGLDGGQLNPDWTEWLMGFPIGHTALKPSATPKSRSKPRLRGKS